MTPSCRAASSAACSAAVDGIRALPGSLTGMTRTPARTRRSFLNAGYSGAGTKIASPGLPSTIAKFSSTAPAYEKHTINNKERQNATRRCVTRQTAHAS